MGEDKILHPVDMRCFCAPCLAYVVKRLGVENILHDYPEAFMELLKVPVSGLYKKDVVLTPGDILVWCTDDDMVHADKRFVEPAAVSVDYALRVVHMPVVTDIHFGVVEPYSCEKALISDCVFDDHQRLQIRMRRLENIKPPQAYIKYDSFIAYLRAIMDKHVVGGNDE